jgi:hypothetical protein
MHESNARNFSVWLSLSQARKNGMSFLLFLMIFLQQKLKKKRAEQDLPGSEWDWEKGGRKWTAGGKDGPNNV